MIFWNYVKLIIIKKIRAGDLLVFVEQALRIKSEFNGRGYTPKITSWILNFIKVIGRFWAWKFLNIYQGSISKRKHHSHRNCVPSVSGHIWRRGLQVGSERSFVTGSFYLITFIESKLRIPKSDIPKEEQARANGKYLNGSKLRTVIGTRKWIIRSITELNRQKLKEKAIENSMKSDVISSRAALQRMIASGTVEYSEKHEKHIAEIFWFPYVLDTEMHGTIIGGKQSQFHSKSEKRFISTGTGYILSKWFFSYQ